MTSPTQASGQWTRGRWWLTVALVLTAQLGLIFALGERRPPSPRLVSDVPSLRFAATRGEWLELQDPTLFTRPHARGFSAGGWLKCAPVNYPVFHWSEPARPLGLPLAQLGEVFQRFMQTNVFVALTLEARPAPEAQSLEAPQINEAFPPESRLYLAGGLISRRVLNPPPLRSWTGADLLTNTVVQLQVDAEGRVHSALVVQPQPSLQPEVDRHALELARGLRFSPQASGNWLDNPLRQLTRGLLIFQWRTEPLAPTNSIVPPP